MQIVRRSVALHQGHIGENALALDVMWKAHHRRLGHFLVGYQRAFNFRRAHAVTRHVDHVVHSPGDPVIAVLVAAAAVAGEIIAFIGGKIGLDEARVILEHGAHNARPGIGHAQVSLAGAVQHVAVIIDDDWLDAKEGPCGRTRFQGCGAGKGSDEDAAGFGLPPGVDDGAPFLAHHVVIPVPGFRVDGFAHRGQNPQ